MDTCEMIGTGKAFVQGDYKGNPGIDICLCEIEDGNCPYGNAGDAKECMDKKTRYGCRTNGKVEKSGLIKSLEDITTP